MPTLSSASSTRSGVSALYGCGSVVTMRLEDACRCCDAHWSCVERQPRRSILRCERVTPATKCAAWGVFVPVALTGPGRVHPAPIWYCSSSLPEVPPMPIADTELIARQWDGEIVPRLI